MQKAAKEPSAKPVFVIVTALFLLSTLAYLWNRHESKFAHSQIERILGISTIKNRAYFASTGWEDSQTYMRFTTSTKEVLEAAERLHIPKGESFYPTTIRKTFGLWQWAPQPTSDSCIIFHAKEINSDVWIQHDTKTGVTYYFSTTY